MALRVGALYRVIFYWLFSRLRGEERGEEDTNFHLKKLRSLPQFLLPLHLMLELGFAAPVVSKKRRWEGSEGRKWREVRKPRCRPRMLLDGAWGLGLSSLSNPPPLHKPWFLVVLEGRNCTQKEEARVGTSTLTQAQIQLERQFRHGNLMSQTIIKHTTCLTAKLERLQSQPISGPLHMMGFLSMHVIKSICAPWGIEMGGTAPLAPLPFPKQGYGESTTLKHLSIYKPLYSSPLNITGWLDFRQSRIHPLTQQWQWTAQHRSDINL